MQADSPVQIVGRDVAIEFLRPDLAEQPAVRGRFEHEARVATRLSHASAVTVLDSGEADGVPCLVMGCLPGRTFADVGAPQGFMYAAPNLDS